jgi:O-antigen/teichoic acid export membrane protein
MAAALPVYLGMAVTAEPLVLLALGNHWAGAAPAVRLLACAMPFMTLYVLMPPATDAIGRPGIGVRAAMIGAGVLPIACAVGVRWGLTGLAAAWLIAWPVMLAVLASRALPAIEVGTRELARAIAPAVQAAVAMAVVLLMVDGRLPPFAAAARLGVLVATGACVYASWMLIFSRPTVRTLWAMVRPR